MNEKIGKFLEVFYFSSKQVGGDLDNGGETACQTEQQKKPIRTKLIHACECVCVVVGFYKVLFI